MLITDLPDELIEHILLDCSPEVVATAAQSCRDLRKLVYFAPDQHLWRALYLAQALDDPRECLSPLGVPTDQDQINWKAELQKVTRARIMLRVRAPVAFFRKSKRMEFLETLVRLVSYVPSLMSDPDGGYDGNRSMNLRFVVELLRRNTTILDDPEAHDDAEAQLYAKLHTLYGLTSQDVQLPKTKADSRAIVYSLRNYRVDNHYGPFLPNSQMPDWTHLRAIQQIVSIHVLGLGPNNDMYSSGDTGDDGVVLESWQDNDEFPLSLRHTQIDRPLKQSPEAMDWAGVTGRWIVSFCFCDHRDLIRYNESAPPDEPLDTSLFSSSSFREIYRSLSVELQVTNAAYTPDTIDDKTAKPRIYFAGSMTIPTSSTMTGWVQMTPDGHVRWHFVSGETGNAIWSSEGVQIGGIGSAYGVLGSWTTIFHDLDDPVGPFWLRKSKCQHSLSWEDEDDSD